jgi:hypothetical protein
VTPTSRIEDDDLEEFVGMLLIVDSDMLTIE